MDKNEIKERASNKAFAKLHILYIEREDLKKEIKENNQSIVPIETLETMVESNEREIKTWNYIAKLIELDTN